jgi:hypothetical protein
VVDQLVFVLGNDGDVLGSVVDLEVVLVMHVGIVAEDLGDRVLLESTELVETEGTLFYRELGVSVSSVVLVVERWSWCRGCYLRWVGVVFHDPVGGARSTDSTLICFG